ncbi:MAG: S9 family peptidase [Opitutaceae bacterium]|jgi:dipeptidyl aminopeptidase/acylaminoacyl peptidase|nr:S9 family peptidase [Opitutaceae bacterium]
MFNPTLLRACTAAALFLTTSLLAADAPPAKPVATTPAALSATDFFRPPALSTARLSPGGARMGVLVYDERTDSTGIRIFDFATRKTSGLLGTKVYDLRNFRWSGDDRLVFSATKDNIYASGLYVAQWDLIERPTLLNQWDAVQVVGSPKERPNHLFVWVRRSARDDGRPGPLVEIDVSRRNRKPFDQDIDLVVNSLEFPPGESVRNWMQDRKGEIRYAVSINKGKPQLFRRDDSKKWTLVNLELNELKPLAVDADPNQLLVARLTPDGLRELVRYNTVDGTSGPVLYKDDKYDFGTGSISYSASEEEVIGLTYSRHAVTHVWLRDEEAALQKAVDQALPPERVNLIVSRSRDGARLLVQSSSDRHPGTLYLVEPRANSAAVVGDLAPWLPEQLLGPVRFVTYPARDGLKLDAYVTLPLNHEPSKPAPMIVLPHGGPWVRDNWGYDPVSQFFASRGYVVFRPNYRGSSGYNAEISLKPRMEFRKMHDDVTDGVRALIKSGIADPARIAICGGSFGGYLAICGAAFEPDLYKCAITIAGIFDWAKVMKEARAGDPDSSRYDQLLRDLGDPKKQQDKFEAMSPILSAEQIKIPVFIAHGEEDQVADASQSHRLAKALAKAGVPHEKMFASGEAHGFASLKNRVELYQRIESFLKKHL